MLKQKYTPYSTAAALLFASVAFGQSDFQLQTGRQPGWDPRAREGRCEVRVWVDNQAELRMRGDAIFVHTLEGGRSYDEGSTCSSPIPYNAVSAFQLRQIGGRNRINLRQEPNRANNYTALIAISDNQGGGDHYAYEVTWRANGSAPNTPAPFFDDIRACQDSVRHRLLGKSGQGAYVDFDGSANRRGQDKDRDLIQGRGYARNWNDARDLTYSCNIESLTGKVRSTDYQYSTPSLRPNDSNRLK